MRAREADQGDSAAIEVLELDRTVPQELPAERQAVSKWWAVIGLGVAIALGIILLPQPAPERIPADDSLPSLAVPTTLPASEEIRTGVVGENTFPTHFVPSLGGYTYIAGPAFHEGLWWVVAQRDRPMVLASTDGVEWQEQRQLPTDGGLTAIEDLIGTRGALLAVGVEDGATKVWRSADGITWIPEVVATEPVLSNTRIAAFGHNLVVTGTRASSIYVGTSDEQYRLYHSSFFTQWEEVPVDFSLAAGIVLAPEGGFVLNSGEDGLVFTSAYGGIWHRNQAFHPGNYSQWGDRLLRQHTRAGEPAITVLGVDDRSTLILPEEFESCEYEGALTGMLAMCANESRSAGFDLYLSEDGSVWSKAEAALLTDNLVYEGFTDRGFLLSMTGPDGTLTVTRADFS
jgi:hypothetical protein